LSLFFQTVDIFGTKRYLADNLNILSS